MKKCFFGIWAIILAIGFSAFRATNYICFEPATPDAANILNVDNYSQSSLICSGPQIDPCQIDLDLITGETPNVTNATQLVNYLQTNFASSVDRINFLRSVSPFKKP